jgi:hypothetical protein
MGLSDVKIGLLSKTMVVSVAETPGHDPSKHG